MDGMLSQEEINALLGGADSEPDADAAASAGTDVSSASASSEERLSPEEGDALGEIANISMGTAATTLSVLLNNRVEITTPALSYVTVDDLKERNQAPCVFVYIAYRTGLEGRNVLVLKERDVKIITDLMMGGDGTNTDVELSDLHLSAISEAMNQMMGSAATSLSSMLNKMIDISPPEADVIDMSETVDAGEIDSFLAGEFVMISFRMEIGDLVNSNIMQLYPFSFAREMCSSITQNMENDVMATASASQDSAASTAAPAPQPMPEQQAMPGQMGQPMMGQPMMGGPMGGQPMMGGPMMAQPMMSQAVNVQPAQFQAFAPGANPAMQSENIDLIMDVPLDVTVELGRTSKSIQEILDFVPGTIIELNKIAGEPIDVLVNGKYVAKGEVVVIEESFGVRITEIIK